MENLQQQVPGSAPGKDAPTNLRAQVVKVLSNAILTGKYRPGDRLNESQIARELNMSRIPVREALSQIQEQGLVQSRERRGMFVTNLGLEEVEQIYIVRLVLENEALRLARIHMTPQILAELEGILARMDAWNGALLESAALDLEFHRTLWKASGNPYLERMLNSLIVPLFAHKTLDHVTHDVRRWRLSHHRILLDTVLGVPQDDLQDVLKTHMRMARTEPERYSELPEKVS
jgi:DNA-binding GntR family transcriptional regulator